MNFLTASRFPGFLWQADLPTLVVSGTRSAELQPFERKRDRVPAYPASRRRRDRVLKIEHHVPSGAEADQPRQCTVARSRVGNEHRLTRRLVRTGAYVRQDGLAIVKAPDFSRSKGRRINRVGGH